MRLPCIECPINSPGQTTPCKIGPEEMVQLRVNNDWAGATRAILCKEERIEGGVVSDALTRLNSFALLKSLVEARYDHEPRRSDLVEVDISSGTRKVFRPIFGVFVDLDNFGEKNKKEDHDFGDKGLKAIARLLVSKTRDSDLYGRRSGDEFVGVLPGMTPDVAGRKLEEIRDACSEGVMVTTPDGSEVNFTASVGGAYTLNAASPRDVFWTLSCAGASLMSYKDGGKVGPQPELVIARLPPENYEY